MEVSSELNVLAALPLEKQLLVPPVWEAGWSQSWSCYFGSIKATTCRNHDMVPQMFSL